MKKLLSVAIVASIATAGMAGQGEAKGCVRGAVAGAVAGHYAHHHAVMGAVGGCVLARHYYKHKAVRAHG